MGAIWEVVLLDPGEMVSLRKNGNLVTLVNVRCWFPPFSASIVMLNKRTGDMRIGPQAHCGEA